MFFLQNLYCVNWICVSPDSLTRYISFTKSRFSHTYYSPLPLDVTYFENCYPTKKKIVCSTFHKDRVYNSRAQCISHTISHWNTSACRCLWATLKSSPNTVHICTRHRRWTGTLDFKMMPLLLDCLVLGLNGYSAR